MKREYFVAMAISVLVLAFTMSFAPLNKEDSTTSLTYHSLVQVYTRGPGEDWKLISSRHNLVTNGGLNFIRDCLSTTGQCGAATSNFSFIAIGGNTSALGAGDTILANEYSTNGLSRTVGTVNVVGTGNWSVTKTWTDTTAASPVNTTGLFNASSSGTLFAENYFTPVTLQINDQINVTWTIWVS
jgi:hypothetical protein